jgi:hypothetical protein
MRDENLVRADLSPARAGRSFASIGSQPPQLLSPVLNQAADRGVGCASRDKIGHHRHHGADGRHEYDRHPSLHGRLSAAFQIDIGKLKSNGSGGVLYPRR